MSTVNLANLYQSKKNPRLQFRNPFIEGLIRMSGANRKFLFMLFLNRLDQLHVNLFIILSNCYPDLVSAKFTNWIVKVIYPTQRSISWTCQWRTALSILWSDSADRIDCKKCCGAGCGPPSSKLSPFKQFYSKRIPRGRWICIGDNVAESQPDVRLESIESWINAN